MTNSVKQGGHSFNQDGRLTGSLSAIPRLLNEKSRAELACITPDEMLRQIELGQGLPISPVFQLWVIK